jgi:hypothetical protein
MSFVIQVLGKPQTNTLGVSLRQEAAYVSHTPTECKTVLQKIPDDTLLVNRYD